MSRVYGSKEIPRQIVEDVESAPIPELHKVMYRWVKRFTCESWDMTHEDVETLRKAGVTETVISQWVQIAGIQTWFVMSADGGGVALDTDDDTGIAVKFKREWYEKSPEGLIAGAPGGGAAGGSVKSDGVCWIECDESDAEYQTAVQRARKRYGFVPNILKACSLWPQAIERHTAALELLEGPQSDSLSPRRHAMVRALVAGLNRSRYSEPTTRALLERSNGATAPYEKVTGPWTPEEWDETDRVVLAFALKAARSTYKITAADAQSFRDAGLDDEAYIDVLNTVSIQTSIDRMANSLGVAPDERPMLAVTEASEATTQV